LIGRSIDQKKLMNSAIIVAAGSGKRFGAEIPKQFVELSGKPILIHTLEKFDQCKEIGEIILVLSSSETSGFLKVIEKYPIKKLAKIVAGGKTRAESVSKGFQAIRPQNSEIVVIHDGARPLVSVKEISNTILRAAEKGAACLVAPVTDTIKRVFNETITQTIDRNELRRALTPQAFKFEILKRAFAESKIDETATDECYLVEKLGIEISVVEGSSRNIKITSPEDIAVAEALLKYV
jgi:2-C-methyl-D-erythritol 4-phosphate cytidylyltransferase